MGLPRSFLLAVATVLICAAACVRCARMGPTIELVMADIPAAGLQFAQHQGLLSNVDVIRNVAAEVSRRKDKDVPAYVTIKFLVPPSAADDFEDAWLDLEEKTHKEDRALIFNLQKTRGDNLIYIGYSEWDTVHDLHDHLISDHFDKFSKFADKNGVRWDVQLLNSLSEDIEEAQQHQRKGHGLVSELSDAALEMLPDPKDTQAQRQLAAELMRRKDLVHLLTVYYVPPAKKEKFVDAWLDAAEETVREKGNRVIALRKVASDNSRFYSYATWDSLGALYDHYASKHHQKLMEHVESHDIVYFGFPLSKLGHEKE